MLLAHPVTSERDLSDEVSQGLRGEAGPLDSGVISKKGLCEVTVLDETNKGVRR